MHIIVDNGGYNLNNIGDIAMLQVTVARLTKLFPHSKIDVFTEKPDLLRYACPIAQPLDLYGRNLLLQPFNIFGKTRMFIPRKYHDKCVDFEGRLRLRMPGITTLWIYYRLQKRGQNCLRFKEFQKKIQNASLVVAAGGGYFNNTFVRHAKQVLHTLGIAQQQNKPTVMFGQGIGPISDPSLTKMARDILPKVDLIGLRESILGPKLLSEFGVSPDRIAITGDDAIELIQADPKAKTGNNVGINIRIASYSNISTTHVDSLREILNNFANRVQADFTAVPIAFGTEDNDLKGIRALLPCANFVEPIFPKSRISSPQQIMQAAKICRIVVTGSYHAAVFALSQGIPVVGLSGSEYYVSKFKGLENQFQHGVHHVILNENSFAANFERALENAWNCAPSVRAPLLEAANRQIQAGKAFYARVQHLIQSRAKI